MKRRLSLLLAGLVTIVAVADARESTAGARRSRAKDNTSMSAELEQIKAILQRQQQEIEHLKQQVAARDQALETALQARNAQSAATQAVSKADTAASQGSATQQSVTALQTGVKEVKASATTALALQEDKKPVAETEGPPAIRYKGVTITPGGFLATETVWRQHALTADVNTPFNTIPFAGAGQEHLSEFFGSGRPSRLTLLVEGKTENAKFTGYYEMDWLSAGVTSNANQSNSYTNRQRQMWGQAALNHGWTFTGGQMWSLITETRNGLDNRTEALPSVIDHNYHVGFSWSRQFGFRTVKNFNNKVWLGFSIENAQTLMTAHGAQNNFVFGTPGTGGGLYNATANYSLNISPDYVAKAAFQPKYGHYEIFGIIRPMRDRVYPNATATAASSDGAYNDTRVGRGIGANARWLFHNKHVEFGIHGLGGVGVGRYGNSGLPDATVRPDGTLSLLRSYQGLATLEFHHPRLDVYFNGGTEHVSRYSQLRSGATPVGYGSPLFDNSGCLTEAVPSGNNGFSPGAPSKCAGDTRNLFQFTAGFYIKFYNGTKGRVQWGPQYSRIIRNSWSGVGGGPQATENMVLTSFRYYLP